MKVHNMHAPNNYFRSSKEEGLFWKLCIVSAKTVDNYAQKVDGEERNWMKEANTYLGFIKV